jgi:acetyl/propionyl-CoA carboxylase alpha subunit
MELIVRRGEREERVQVFREGDHYRVVVGEQAYLVDAVRPRPGLHSLRIDGGQHEVAIRRNGHGGYWVTTAYEGAAVEVLDPLTHLAAQGSGGKGGRRRQKVTAYMPGRVVALLARERDHVASGQGVLVLEAMKMENEIRAEHEGTITKIYVQPGTAVDAGDPLFDLE